MKFILIALAIIYLLSPYDILPDFFAGWGWLDDGAIAYMIWRYYIAPALEKKQSERAHRQGQQYHQYRQSAGEKADRGESSPYRDPYQILEIERNASQEDVQKAYKRLAAKYHPDKVHHLGEEFKALAEERFKEIQEAYQALRSGG